MASITEILGKTELTLSTNLVHVTVWHEKGIVDVMVHRPRVILQNRKYQKYFEIHVHIL